MNPIGLKLFNSLPNNIREIKNDDTYKRETKQWLFKNDDVGLLFCLYAC